MAKLGFTAPNERERRDQSIEHDQERQCGVGAGPTCGQVPPASRTAATRVRCRVTVPEGYQCWIERFGRKCTRL